MTTLVFHKKQQLVDALEARRRWAERLDAKRLWAHSKTEAKALRDFRALCAAAQKWDYETLKSEDFRFSLPYNDRPRCPTSVVAQLDRLLSDLKLTRQERFTLDNRGLWSGAHHLLTFDENAKPEMC